VPKIDARVSKGDRNSFDEALLSLKIAEEFRTTRIDEYRETFQTKMLPIFTQELPRNRALLEYNMTMGNARALKKGLRDSRGDTSRAWGRLLSVFGESKSLNSQNKQSKSDVFWHCLQFTHKLRYLTKEIQNYANFVFSAISKCNTPPSPIKTPARPKKRDRMPRFHRVNLPAPLQLQRHLFLGPYKPPLQTRTTNSPTAPKSDPPKPKPTPEFPARPKPWPILPFRPPILFPISYQRT
jgi:hypothetical protein